MLGFLLLPGTSRTFSGEGFRASDQWVRVCGFRVQGLGLGMSRMYRGGGWDFGGGCRKDSGTSGHKACDGTGFKGFHDLGCKAYLQEQGA